VYHPPIVKHRKTDGAAFGSTLPHLLLQRYPRLTGQAPDSSYVPRIFGFEVHSSAAEMQVHRGEGREEDEDEEGEGS
jgi:hypothetical protein